MITEEGGADKLSLPTELYSGRSWPLPGRVRSQRMPIKNAHTITIFPT